METERQILIKSRSMAATFFRARWENLGVVTTHVLMNHNDELGGSTDVAEVAGQMYRHKVEQSARRYTQSERQAQQNTQLILSNGLKVNNNGEFEIIVPLLYQNGRKGGE